MDAATVVALIQLLENNGVEVYVDGGWAVDALLGSQSRPHDDLDVAIPHSQVGSLRALLATLGYRDWPRKDSWECNFVLADGNGNRIDVHSYLLDDTGGNRFGIGYIGQDLTGSGVIDGHPVRCIGPESLLRFHTGYAVDETDYHDVRLLCRKFGLAMPRDYESFLK